MLSIHDLEAFPGEESQFYLDVMRLPVLSRYGARPLQDIIPLVFVMYAVIRDVELHFDDGRLEGSGTEGFGKGDVLDDLYRHTVNRRIDGKCREAEELLEALVRLEAPRHKAMLSEFLEAYILLRPNVNDSPVYPGRLSEELVRILSGHGAKRVYESGSGLGLVSRVYDGWESYTAYDLGDVNMLFAQLLQELAGKRKVMYSSRDYLPMPYMMTRYDTVVLNILNMEIVHDFIGNLKRMTEHIFAAEGCRLVIFMVNYAVCAGERFEEFRKSLCDKGVLEEVIEVDKDCFRSDASRSAVLVLNMEGTECRQVMFRHVSRRIAGHGDLAVPYEELASCHFVLESRLYVGNPFSFDYLPSDAGSTTVLFGSLVKEFVKVKWFSEKDHPDCKVCLTGEDYSRTPPEVFSLKAPHVLPPLPARLRQYQSGPAVSIHFVDDGECFKVCRIAPGKSGYTVPEKTVSFIPSDDVDVSYLIYLLFAPMGISEVLRGIREMFYEGQIGLGAGEYLADILASRPVKIVPDMERQAEIVRKVARSGEEVVKTDNEYGVVIVGTPLSDVERGDLWSWKLKIIAETDSIDGLDGILKEDKVGAKDVDAVFFDVNVESGGPDLGHLGLFRAMNASGPVPLVVFSDTPLDSFGPQERSFYDLSRANRKGDRFIFKDDESAVRNAVRDLRDGLDAQRSPDRAVKAKYSVEIELAKRLDPSGNMAANLVKAMRGEFEDAEDPKEVSERIGLLRQGAETVFNAAKERGLLPPLAFLGAMQQFLEDGEYFDNGAMRFYRLTENVMPETLSCAFNYFVTIVNGGMHARQEGKLDVIGYISRVARSTNIYRSCAFILMDLLKWYGGLKAEGPLYEETTPFRDDDLVGKARNGNRDYYYIGGVHLGYTQGLAEGIPGKDIRLRRVSLEKLPVPPGVENEIRYFSSDYKIDR